MDRRNNPSAVLLVLAAGVLWGTVGPAQVLAGSAANPVAVGGARILSGGVILAALVLAADPRAFRTLSRRTWPPVAAASAATGVFQASFFSAVGRTGAAVATAVVFGLAPVSTGLCERLVLRTRLGGRWWAGTACAIGGVALLTAPGPDARVDLLGVGLSLVAGTCFGVYTVSAKVLTGRSGPGGGATGMAAAVSVTLLAGGSVLLPWTLADLPALAAPRSAALVAWLGVAATAAAYMFFVTGLNRVSAATAGTLSLAEPLVAAVLAVAVLGERMSGRVAAGAVLLLGGLVVVSLPARTRPDRRTRREPEAARYDGANATGAVKVETTTGERN
ncbi:EamA family transporter [Actinomadura nitritigenes]|uniref:DMT family transporter n=1 Tax=Actinomadura nitritigenes TaxID=134602 RepID=A0ABS3QZQ9_9ACTN|nr:DMT family transporter [Actinomadura nitritigenes]